jgi:hypothetical protein
MKQWIMYRKSTFNLVFLLWMMTPSFANADPCEMYRDINMTISLNRNVLRYDLSMNGTTTPPYVDSVWIATGKDMQIIQTYYVQSGEPIDISFLEKGYYILYIQLGNCVMGRTFIWRGEYGTANQQLQINQESSVYKVFKNGMLLIIHGDRIYTIQAVPVKPF